MNETTQTANETAEVASMETIEARTFAQSNLEAGMNYANECIAIAEANGAVPVFAFDTDKEFPAGYGLAVVPITKIVNNERSNINVCIAAIPEFTTVAQAAGGQAWIEEIVQNALVTKVRNAVRPRADGATALTIPFSVEDFITRAKAESTMTGFNALASGVCKTLKDKVKGLVINKELLRNALSSKAFAEEFYSKLPQEVWVKVLDSMIAAASGKQLAVSAMQEWRETRDNAGLPEAQEVDVDGLDFSDL